MRNIALVKMFCEAHFDEFQEFLETVCEIESSEAEVILGRLQAVEIVPPFQVYRVVGEVCIMWAKKKEYAEVSRQDYLHQAPDGVSYPYVVETVEMSEEEYKGRPEIWWTWK